MELRFAGERRLLALVAQDLAEDSFVGPEVEIAVLDRGSTGTNLHYDNWGELVVTLVTGVATNALYDAIRLAVDRWRDHGEIQESDSGHSSRDD